MKPNFHIVFALLCACLCLCPLEASGATEDEYYVRHISSDEGLGFSWVWQIDCDGEGYMWFATTYAAYRYNGYDMATFAFKDADGNNASVNFCHESADGYIWFGTNEAGLFRYDKRDCSMTHYDTSADSVLPLPSNTVRCVAEDAEGVLWLGTGRGVVRFDYVAGLATVYDCLSQTSISTNVSSILYDSRRTLWVGDTAGNIYRRIGTADKFETTELKIDVKGRSITDLFEDTDRNIWIATNGAGVVKYNLQNGRCVVFNEQSGTLTNNIARAMVQDEAGTVFVGTECGLTLISANGKVDKIFADENRNDSLNDNAIYSLYIDDKESIWIGTFFGGVNIMQHRRQLFNTILSSGNGYNGVAVSSIAKHDGRILVGTETDGLFVLDDRNGTQTNLRTDNSRLLSNNIHSVKFDSFGNLWVGCYYGGLSKKGLRNADFVNYLSRPNDTTSLAVNNVYSILQDSRGNLWVGTQYGGLCRYDYRQERFERVRNGLDGGMFVWDILEDKDGNIWLACYGSGVYKLDVAQDYHATKINSRARNFVTLCELSDGHILAGTEKHGMIEIDVVNLSVKEIALADKLPDNTVYAVVQDKNHNIWFSTNSGLYKTDSSFSTFKNYTVKDGLPTNRFNYNAAEKIDGALYFGSINGLVIVDVDKESAAELNRPIQFDNLYINNEKSDIVPREGVALNYADRLVFTYTQNIWGIDFSSNIYDYDANVRYAYRLEGLDDQWHNLGVSRRVNFTGLKYGNYRLSVCSVDADGKRIGNVRSIDVVMLPPWWQSKTALILYVLATLAIVGYFIMLVLNNQRSRHALELAKIEHDKEKEINDLKLNFFVNISHEFKTPLSLIIGPVEQIMDKKEALPELTKERYFHIVRDNAEKLLSLINELLDFRELQQIKLQFTRTEYYPILLASLNRHMWLFEEKNIAIDTKSINHDAIITADTDKLGKILDNLISNAAKYTPTGGKVKIKVSCDDKGVTTVIRNSGAGIVADKLPYIFDRFFTGHSYDRYSSGVGLSYVKSLVELHRGTITATSTEGQYAQFEFTIPYHENLEIVEVANEDLTPYFTMVEANTLKFESDTAMVDEPTMQRLASQTNVLIVEDDYNMQMLLTESLRDKCVTIITDSSEKALEIISKERIDIVVSDVMMDVMTGFELCNRIKSNIETSHIRVVLMTVLSENDYKRMGYMAGADAYLVKPFDFKILEQIVKNMIIGSYLAREHYKIDINLSNVDIANSNSDEAFLKQVVDIVFSHLADSEFNVDSLCKAVVMSKTSLYRKLKAITGQSINEFVQNVRLKYAAQLLNQTERNISEICYDVGFSDTYYFSRAFKKCFGVSPRTWRENGGKPISQGK